MNETIAETDSNGVAEKLRRLSSAAAAASQVAEDDRAARNTAIYEASTAGWSLSKIAAATGMRRGSVHRIVIEQESYAWATTS